MRARGHKCSVLPVRRVCATRSTIQEDEKLLQLRGQQSKSFAKIAEQIDGRSYNDVKNRWSQISRQIAALKVRAFFFLDKFGVVSAVYLFIVHTSSL